MINEKHKTAAYKIIPSQGGNRYSFFCELSGMLVCTTGTYYADDFEAELSAAWEAEGKKNFNLCHMCGRWVDSIVYNPDMLMCVNCAPLEEGAKYCKHCGAKANNGDIICFVNIKNCFLRKFHLTNFAKLVFCSLYISATRADFKPFHIFGAKTEMLQNIFS